MEGRELLELPDIGLFENMLATQPSTPSLENSLLKMEEDIFKEEEDIEDYCNTIKPEDMLVPLSDQQPPTTPSSPPPASTPPASPLHYSTSPINVPDSLPTVPVSPPQAPAPVIQIQTRAPLPKVIICRKVDTSTLRDKPVKVHYQVMPAKEVPKVTISTPQQPPIAAPGNSQKEQAVVMPLAAKQEEPQTTVACMGAPQTSGAEEELINEMVQLIGSNNAGTIFQGFDTEIEANMEELLLQLEASNKALITESDSQSLLSVPLPSASPSSFASLSPHPSETSFSGTLSSPCHSESTFPPSPLSLPSPVPSVGSLSPAQSSSDSLFHPDETSSTGDCLEEEWSPLEETHSYSKSTRKAKSTRRTPSSRRTPYPEDRKERKKEQNKQAALRYRQKKKQEEDDLAGKIKAEEERQEKLKSSFTNLKQELSYLKKIMREVFVAKGVLSEEALKKAALAKKNASK